MEDCTVWFSLVKSGNLDALKRLIGNNSEVLMTIKDSDGMSLLHKAALCRQRSIVSYIQGMKTRLIICIKQKNYICWQKFTFINKNIILGFTSREDNLVLGGVDNKGNNVLHLAAAKQQSSSHLLRNAKVEMQNDLAWFKVNFPQNSWSLYFLIIFSFSLFLLLKISFKYKVKKGLKINKTKIHF